MFQHKKIDIDDEMNSIFSELVHSLYRNLYHEDIGKILNKFDNQYRYAHFIFVWKLRGSDSVIRRPSLRDFA